MSEDRADWSVTTWEGSRREQLRRWMKLTLREKLQAVEEMAKLSERLAQAAKHHASEPEPRK